MKKLITIFLVISGLTVSAQIDTVTVDSTQYNEVKSLLSFYNYLLNTIGSSKTSTRNKEVIITESYKKVFTDSKVQIEDDLIEDRKVITNKDVNAYLRDVDFFFLDIDFQFGNTHIEKITRGDDSFFYLISFESTINGTTIEKQVLTSTKRRFIEVNLDEEEGDLKIASIYSTKVSRIKELQNWWSSLSFGWVNVFNDYVQYDSITNQVLLQIASIDSLNISGNQFIQNLEPLTALKDLESINVSNTKVKDLSPLRYSRELRQIDASNSIISDLSPLQYFESLTHLDLEASEVTDISTISRLKKLSSLNLSSTSIIDFSPIKGLKNIQNIDLSNTSFSNPSLLAESNRITKLNLSRTMITDLSSFQSITNLRELNISETAITDLSYLSNLPNLEILRMDQTPVKSLEKLTSIPSLLKIYADNTSISEQQASAFMAEKPETVVVANSEQIMEWWNSLSANWRNVFTSVLGGSNSQKEDIIRLINMDSLDVSKQNFFELNPLKKFKRLKYLDVSHNLFTSFEFTEEMTDLVFLNAEKLPIETTEGLEININLKGIILKGSLLNNIESISSLNKLELIDADNTALDDKQVTTFLESNSKAVVIYRSNDLLSWWQGLSSDWQNQFNIDEIDTNYLHKLTQSKTVSIKGSSISSLAPLSMFINLKKISLDQVRVNSLKDVFIHRGLNELSYTNGPLQSLDGITQLSQLTSLNISNTAVENLKELEGLSSLKDLKCSGLQIKNLKGVESLYQIESIDFSNTRVWKLQRLYGMNKIKKVVCNNTRLREHTIGEFQEAFPNCEIVFY
ncbi:MAG: leucine-rich repeat domain-containing protein [Ekhidna sp.]